MADMTTEGAYIPWVDDSRFPARTGNLVRPLIDGLPAFRRICEVVERAQHSVFVTVAFIHPSFEMPDGRGSFFDVLERAARRGLDVRVVFWRTEQETQAYESTCFVGDAQQQETLRSRNSMISIRWDRAGDAFCHHQKSWIADAGTGSEVAFVGGINLNPSFVVSPGHRDRPDGAHDAYVEIRGPSAADIHRNFVERWNDASDRVVPDGVWGPKGQDDLEERIRPSRPCGSAVVQIQRTLRRGGEHDIFKQYNRAIESARHAIYIENQALEDPETVARLEGALRRGVVVVALVPAPDRLISDVDHRSESVEWFSPLTALGNHDGFTLAGISVLQADGTRSTIQVHAKLMLVDDVFATIGSCNIRPRSFHTQTELNASIVDAAVVRRLREQLFAEHADIDTSAMDATAALRSYAAVARENATRNADWRGNVFAFSPSQYRKVTRDPGGALARNQGVRSQCSALGEEEACRCAGVPSRLGPSMVNLAARASVCVACARAGAVACCEYARTAAVP
jgi:cardiolipin synthase A/B